MENQCFFCSKNLIGSMLYHCINLSLHLIKVKKMLFMQLLWIRNLADLCSRSFIPSVIYQSLPNIKTLMRSCKLNTILHQWLHSPHEIGIVWNIFIDCFCNAFWDRGLRQKCLNVMIIWMLIWPFSSFF